MAVEIVQGNRVELPVVGGDTRLLDALRIMRERGRSAIIRDQGAAPVVITVNELVELVRARGDITCREFEPQEPTVDASMDSTLESLEHPAIRRAVEASLESRGAQQAVIALLGSTGIVLTRSAERAGAFARSVLVCTCTTDTNHVFLHDELVQAGKCNLDGANVDCS